MTATRWRSSEKGHELGSPCNALLICGHESLTVAFVEPKRKLSKNLIS